MRRISLRGYEGPTLSFEESFGHSGLHRTRTGTTGRGRTDVTCQESQEQCTRKRVREIPKRGRLKCTYQGRRLFRERGDRGRGDGSGCEV